MKRKAKRTNSSEVKRSRGNVKIKSQNDDGFGTSIPPSFANVQIYFDQKGLLDVAPDFYEEHELKEWKSQTNIQITNWKVCAAEWIFNHRQEVKRKFRLSPFNTESF